MFRIIARLSIHWSHDERVGFFDSHIGFSHLHYADSDSDASARLQPDALSKKCQALYRAQKFDRF